MNDLTPQSGSQLKTSLKKTSLKYVFIYFFSLNVIENPCQLTFNPPTVMRTTFINRLDGKRSRGRPRKKWLDDVKKWGRFTKFSSLVTTAKDRTQQQRLAYQGLTCGSCDVETRNRTAATTSTTFC
ncbi:hypothetical protein GQR58_007040 [Nymphon striatum]|nr:hypothetical protein GQR58_007040 [Nymphon striatum]